MSNISQMKGMLFTLGNVNVSSNTKITFPNPEPDPVTTRRSQELYNALDRKLNLTAWACGRYGQHRYSPDLGIAYAKSLKQRMLQEKNLTFDYSIQMAGHPILHHKKPYFIIVDYIPFFDLSIFDTVAYPCVKKLYEGDQDFLYYNATGIITYTPVQRYMLINWLGIDPCKVTSICAGVEGFVNRECKKSNNRNILWVGFDFERKGGNDVLAAYQLLRREDPSYTLTIVGVNNLNISDPGVKVYPFLHGDDLTILDKLYSEAAVFIMPSYKENLGLVYLEAMAHKTPVIVTSRGGLAEIVRRTGVGEVVVPGQINGICHAIRKVLDPRGYEAYSERAYSFAARNATWEIVSQRVQNALERWMRGEPVPDDYNDYSMHQAFPFYEGEVKCGLR